MTKMTRAISVAFVVSATEAERLTQPFDVHLSRLASNMVSSRAPRVKSTASLTGTPASGPH